MRIKMWEKNISLSIQDGGAVVATKKNAQLRDNGVVSRVIIDADLLLLGEPVGSTVWLMKYVQRQQTLPYQNP